MARMSRSAVLASVLGSLLLAPPAKPADDDASAAPRRCVADPLKREIPGFTKAKLDFKPALRYPRDALDAWSEGWVELEFGITPEGAVRDIAVVDATGPKDFVEQSMKSVAAWRYKPATRNGVPVDQFLHRASILYRFEDSERGADHREFIRKYNQARREIQDGQFDKSIATLEEAFTKRLNHYEQAMGSFVLALAYTKKGDWPRALFHIRHAVIENASYLDPVPKKAALALQVELEARNGNLEEAICAFEDLRKADLQAARAGGPAASTIARIEEALAVPGPIAIEARLAKHPLVDAPAVWRHRLLRSKFSFDQIKGEVKSFRLVCVGTTHDAPVELDFRWDVPAQAGPCILRVDGAPDATFRLIEEW